MQKLSCKKENHPICNLPPQKGHFLLFAVDARKPIYINI